MAATYKYIRELLKEIQEEVTRDQAAWMKFLDTAARVYKYSFEDQLLIYSQRPDATACASFQFWNTRMFRWVRGGSRGIALIDDAEAHKLKYVFDVADTVPLPEKGKEPQLWRLEGKDHEEMLSHLQEIYGDFIEPKQDFVGSIVALSKVLAEDAFSEIEEGLSASAHGTPLAQLEESQRNEAFQATLASSVAYVILKRCGYVRANLWRARVAGFQNFKGADTDLLFLVGTYTNELAAGVLREIGRGIQAREKALANQPQREYNALKRESEEQERGQEHGTELQKERGLSHTGSGNGRAADGRSGEIRQDESEIPEGTQAVDVRVADRAGQVGSASDRSEAPGTRDDGISTDPAAQGESGSEQGRPDGLGGSHERDPKPSGGDRQAGDHLQLEPDLFPTEAQQKEAAMEGADQQTAPFLMPQLPQKEDHVPQEFIVEALKRGPRRKVLIADLYAKDLSAAKRRFFIRQEYGEGGASWPIEGTGLNGYGTGSKGFTVFWRDNEGKKEGILSWNEVEKQIHELIQAGTYISEKERQEEREDEQGELSKKEEPAPLHNFRIQDGTLSFGNAKEKFKANLRAIEVLKSLEDSGKAATLEEQTQMANYVGWGGLPDAFDQEKTAWTVEYRQLKALLSESEYASARGSTLNAHYTSPAVIQSIYDVLLRMGFRKGNVLEPAMAVGNFFGLLPDAMQESKLYGVELDSLSSRIARQLYPNADIKIGGYEDTNYPDNFFDLAVGNVPFGNYKVNDRRYDKHGFLIHDYFIAKTLDKVRPGGIVAFITSKGTMDKKSPKVRTYIAERASLIAAVRLPNMAFKQNAGTEVTSDILFLQKRDRPITVDAPWMHLGTDANGLVINQYFIDHPEMVIGTMQEVSSAYGKETACIFPDTNRFEDALKNAMSGITGIFQEAEVVLDDDTSELAANVIPADPTVQNYSYAEVDGVLYYRENSIMTASSVSGMTEKRIRGMIEIRDCTRQVIEMQLSEFSDEEIAAQQKRLNGLYDRFQKKYGLISNRGNDLAFREDVAYPLVCSLEVFDENGEFLRKADMFTKRTIGKPKIVTHVDTAAEALALSLSEKGKVDIHYMEKLSGKNEETLTSELTNVIFKLPTSEGPFEYVTADEYLSGNVREKLATAKLALKYKSGAYQVNVEALKAVQPKDLEASEIEVRLGSTWVDPKYFKAFMAETFDTPNYLLQGSINILYSQSTGLWNVSGKGIDSGVKATVTYGTKRANAYRILEDTLNLRNVQIFDYVLDNRGQEKRELNKKETILACQKQDAMKARFSEWIWEDAERRQDLCKTYNTLFNSNVAREYDGSHLTFPGLNPEITLESHQKNAAAR